MPQHELGRIQPLRAELSPARGLRAAVATPVRAVVALEAGEDAIHDVEHARVVLDEHPLVLGDLLRVAHALVRVAVVLAVLVLALQ